MVSPPQDYTNSELARLVKQPRVEWNIESVANLEMRTAELPIIPTLLNRFAQSIPGNTDMYLKVEVEDIRLPVTSFNIDAESAIEIEFRERVAEWRKDTRGVSSLSEMFMHPAYQRIMAIGKPALPFILRDLRQSGSHWFHALRYIVGEDIAAGTNTVADARAAWLEWGYNNGHI